MADVIFLHVEDFFKPLETKKVVGCVFGCKVNEEETTTRGDDKRQARDRGGFGNFASWGSGFLWGFQLVSDASRSASSEGRPGACAVAPEPDPLQVGNYSIYCRREKRVN